jgi:octaprenyl-diphosphate synthase
MISILNSFVLTKNCRKKIDILEAGLLSELQDSSKIIKDMANHIFGGGGKRVRPVFLLLISEMLGYKGNSDVRVAVAVEYIHTATLIHDDVIDDAGSRRSRATLHSIYDSNLSILFGDYVYATAISIINSLENHRLIEVFSALTQKMIRGEMDESENKFNLDLKYDDYIQIVNFKTAELFAGCGQLGAIIAGSDEKTERYVRDAGLKFGIAFQFIDDMLDFDLDGSQLGKPTFTDLHDGKLTLPSYLLMESDDEGKRIVETIFREKGFVSISKEILHSAVKKRDIEGKVRIMAGALIKEALNSLNQLPENPAHQAIESLAESFIKRER